MFVSRRSSRSYSAAGLLAGAACLLIAVQTVPYVVRVSAQVPDLGDDDFDIEEFSTCKFKTSSADGKLVEYDLSPLEVSNRIDEQRYTTIEANYHVDEKKDEREYEYFLNVCGTLRHNSISDPDTTSLQVRRHANGSIAEHYVTGVLHESRFSSLADGDLRYVMGAGANNRETVIFFFCSDVGLSHPVFADEPEPLHYFFVWNTCAACPLGTPIRDNCREKPANVCSFFGVKTTNAGSVFVIFMVVLFSCYLVFGALYNKFARGHSGIDVIPNLAFWTSCCGAVKTGIVFVFTCGRNKVKPSSAYKTLSANLDSDLDSDLEDASEEQLFK